MPSDRDFEMVLRILDACDVVPGIAACGLEGPTLEFDAWRLVAFRTPHGLGTSTARNVD